MTDTPVDPQDVVIKPPSATAYAKASLPIVLITRVRGAVEKLAAEGASDQEIVEAIRQESPEIADVVEANATRAPRGWSFYQWVVLILMLYGVALQTYEAVRPQTSPPSVEERAQEIAHIKQILEDVLSKEERLPSSGNEEQAPGAGRGGGGGSDASR